MFFFGIKKKYEYYWCLGWVWKRMIYEDNDDEVDYNDDEVDYLEDVKNILFD